MKHWKDLLVWQKSHELVLSVYRITSDFPKSERYGIVDQTRRSAASIPANIVEGHSRNSQKDLSLRGSDPMPLPGQAGQARNVQKVSLILYAWDTQRPGSCPEWRLFSIWGVG